jgi:alcohol dehydrogenase
MNFHMPTRLIFGPGSIETVDRVVRKDIRAHQPFLVTDPNVRQAGLVDKVLSRTDGADVFADVEANPKSTTVNRVGEMVRRKAPDVIIALGGGSAIDAAKAVALLATNQGRIEEYEGREKYATPPLPVIAIPTTCGTGSEVTWVSVITDTRRNFKMSIKGPKLFPAVAVVDPDMLLTLPAGVVASTGMDALTHAIEAFTVKPATIITDVFALKAIQLIWESLPRAYENIAEEKTARENLMYGSTLAGFAFGNSDVGAVHCISESIGALFDVPHGVANAIFLPSIMRFNLPACTIRYARIAAAVGIAGKDERESAHLLVEEVQALSRRIGIPRFADLHIDPKEFEVIARYSYQNNSNPSNPRDVTQQAYMAILEDAHHHL